MFANRFRVVSVITNFVTIIGLLVVLGVLLHQNNVTSSKLQTSIHENFASRVITVTQRCYLTKQTAGLAREEGDQVRYRNLVISYQGCLKQLAALKLTLSETPFS